MVGMTVSRRGFSASLLTLPGALPGAAASSGWTAEWDRALVDAAVRRFDESYDPAERMTARTLGPQYQYHTNLRATKAHPTRDSLEYALLLLAAGGEDRQRRAEQILRRVIALQDRDPASKWYGIWGWYMEEPPPRMSPADWNWADFNGSLLILVHHFHGTRLEAALLDEVRQAILHAAVSVRRRNVSMNYTNIAVKGTFVTLAAAQILADEELRQYARDRLNRLAAAIDVTGSIAEYNSPTYAAVTLANLTRLRMVVEDRAAAAKAGRIEHRVWLHLAKHWHQATRQFAGPMSRCYATDLGAPIWLEKALAGRVGFFPSLDDLKRGLGSYSAGEVGLLDYRCPEELVSYFLKPKPASQHREMFLAGSEGARAVQGTTWIEPAFSLGTANRSEFWIQRRPLLAYWGGPARPARYAQLRFLKDDYDFSSALFYSVQERNCVLAAVNFRSPGGDRHPSLEPVENGQFRCARLRLRLDLAGVPGSAPRWFDIHRSEAAIDLGGPKLWLRVKHAQPLEVAEEDGLLTVSADLVRYPEPRTIRWQDLPRTWMALCLVMENSKLPLEHFAARARRGAYTEKTTAGSVYLQWSSAAGRLGLKAGVAVQPVEAQNLAFAELLNGRPAPLVRLSQEKLAS